MKDSSEHIEPEECIIGNAYFYSYMPTQKVNERKYASHLFKITGMEQTAGIWQTIRAILLTEYDECIFVKVSSIVVFD